MQLIHGDCLIESDKIESGSVDLILTDLPYGTMEGQSKTGIYHNGEEKHEWDSVIDTDKIMQVANRILRKNGKMILFAQEPFTRELINKAIPNLPFNYRAIWLKDTLGSFMRSKSALLYRTEDILIFSKNHEFEGLHQLRPYFKEVFEYIGHTKKTILQQVGQRADHVFRFNSSQFDLCTNETYEALVYFFCIDKMEGFKAYSELQLIDEQFKTEFSSTFNLWEGGKYKDNVFEYKRDRDNFHPTQKPVLLLEDLIKTFSNEGNLVVDLTMGSGSTAIACLNTKRNFIGIEKDDKFFEIAKKRIEEVIRGLSHSNKYFGGIKQMKLIDDTNGDIYDISENRMKHNIIGEINAIIAAGNEHDYSVQINNNIYDIKNAIDYIEKEWKI